MPSEPLFFPLPPRDNVPAHRLVYSEWPGMRGVVVCAHGLTRNRHDFDFLAGALAAEGWRVLALDIAGRGDSEYFSDPAQYIYPNYLTDIFIWLASLNITQCHWVGTSMGGILGMMAAAAAPNMIQKLVLNDIGSFLPKAGLVRILSYAGVATTFPSREAAEQTLRANMAPFGITDETHWQHIFAHSLREESGTVRLNYDPNITVPMRSAEPQDLDLSALWEQVKCPTLVLRGETSDILLRETARNMATREGVTLHEILSTGHAPMLMKGEEIELIKNWLR